MTTKNEKELIITNNELEKEITKLNQKIEDLEYLNNKYKNNYKDIENIAGSVAFHNFLLVILIITFIWIAIVFSFNEISNVPNSIIIEQNNTINKIMFKDEDLTAIFNKIEQNCNSVYITKRYNDENWYVFRALQEPNYIRFENCLTKDTINTSEKKDTNKENK